MLKENSAKITVFQLQQLVAAEGDTLAFERLYLIFHKRLCQFAYGIIKSHHIAEEIVSDIFVQLWKKRSDLESVINLKIFLYTTVRNQALTYLYKSKDNKVSWIDEFGASPRVLITGGDNDQMFVQKACLPVILPPKQKAVYSLIKDHGLKFTEVSRVLNLSVSTIENLMGVALKKVAASINYPNTQLRK